MNRERRRRISCLLLAILLVMGAFPWAEMRTAFAADPEPYFNEVIITKEYDGDTFRPKKWHIILTGGNFLDSKGKLQVEIGVMGSDGKLNRFNTTTPPSAYLLDYEVGLDQISDSIFINGETIDLVTSFPGVSAKEPNTGRVKSGEQVTIRGGNFVGGTLTNYKIEDSDLTNNPPDTIIGQSEIKTKLRKAGTAHFIMYRSNPSTILKKANGTDYATIRIRQSYINIFKVFTDLGVSDDISLIPTRGAVGTGARVEATSLLTVDQMDVFFVKNLSGPFTKEMIAGNKKYLSKTDTGGPKDRFAFQVPNLPVGTYHIVLTNKVDPSKPIDAQISALKILRQSFTIVDAKNQAKLTSINPKKGPTTGIEAIIKGQNLANMSPNFYSPGSAAPQVNVSNPNKLVLTYTGGTYADEPGKVVAKVTRTIKFVVGDLVTFTSDSFTKETVYDYFKVKLGQNTDLTKPIKDVTVEIETTIEFNDNTKIEGILETDVLANAFEYEALDFQPEITGVDPAKIPVDSDLKVTPKGLKITITGKNFFLYRYEKNVGGNLVVKYRYPKFDFGGQFRVDPNTMPGVEIKMYKAGVEIDGTEGRHLADKILLTIPENTPALSGGEAVLDTPQDLILINPLKVPDATDDGSKTEFKILFFKVDPNKAPVINKVEPSRVSTSSQNKKVKVTGQNFSENVKVFLDGEEIRNVKRNGVGTEIDMEVPGGKPVGKYQIRVQNNDGSIATFDDFWYVESFTKPKITDFNPKKGTTYTVVNILGENFLYPNPAISSTEGIGIYNLIGTRVLLGEYEINKYNMQNGKISLNPYDSKTQEPLIKSDQSVLKLADYSDGVILKKRGTDEYYKLYYDFQKGKILLTDGKNVTYEMRGEGTAVKAEKDGTPHPVTVNSSNLNADGQNFDFMTPYAFDSGTGLMNGKKTKILNNGQIQIEVPALPRRGFYDVKVVNPDTNFDAKIGTNGFEYIPGPLDLPPKINTVTPDKGSVEGGYQVVISGENFISEPTRKIRVYFDGVEVDPRSVVVNPGGKEMTVTVPKYKGNLEKETESDRKAVDVVVLNPDGGSDAKKGGFTYVIAKSKPYLDRIIQHPIDPAVQGLRATVEGGDFRFMEPFRDVETLSRPFNGVWDAGETWTDINGNNKWDDYRELIKNGYSSKEKYNKLPADNPIRQKYGDWETLIKPVLPQIFFGGYQAEVIRFTSTSIDVIIPEQARGKVDVYLRNNDEGISNKLPFEIFVTEPTISSIKPNVGRKSGNEPVDIQGAGFENSEVLMYDASDSLPNKKTLVVTHFANETDPKMGNSHIVDMKQENSGLIAGDRAKVSLGALNVRYEGETSPAELKLSYEEYGILYQGSFKFENNEVFVPLRLLKDNQGKALDSHEAVRITHEMLQGTANSYRIRVERGYAEKTELKNNGLYTVWTPSYYTIGQVKVTVYGKDGGKSKGNASFTYKNPDSNPTISDMVKDNDKKDKEIKGKVKTLKVSTNGGNTIKMVGKEFRKPVKITFGDVSVDEKSITYVPAESLNATEMYFTLPKVPESMANKGYKVFIENPDGGTANTGVLTDPVDSVEEIQLFFVQPESMEMKVTEVIPKEGPVAGGTVVTVKGQDFRWEMKGYPNKHLSVYFMRDNQPLLDKDGNVVNNLIKDKTQVNYDTIEFVTPPVEKEGPVDIKIVNPDGNTIFLSGGFKYTQSPLSIISIDPSKGRKQGGDTVTITGTGFMDGKINLYSSLTSLPTKETKMLVRFGDPKDTNISNRDIPEDDLQSGRLLKDGAKFKVGNMDFTVRPNGADFLLDVAWHDFSGEYSAKDIPFNGETSYLPLSLLKSDATEMIKISKKVNGVISRIIVERGYASNVVFNGETFLTVVTPPHHTINRGSGNSAGTMVTVINPDGSEAVGSFIYKNPDSDPAIYSIEVDGVSSDGEEHKGENPVLFRLPRVGKSRITVHGRDFRKNLTLTIAGQTIDEKSITYSDQIGDFPQYKTLTFTMPQVPDELLGKHHILSISNLDGGGTNSDAVVRDPSWNAGKPNPSPIHFAFYLEETEHLKIDSITPNRGPTKGGNQVIIRGEDFRNTMYGFKGKLRIFVGTGVDMVEVRQEDILSVEHDRITLVMPPHEEGEVTVRVQNPDGNTAEGTYKYEGYPVITNVVNEDGSKVTALLPDGSQTIIIGGTGFKEGAKVYFHPKLKKAEDNRKEPNGNTSSEKKTEEIKTPTNVWVDGEAYVIDGSIVATPSKVEDGKKIIVQVPKLEKDFQGIIVVNPDGAASNVWDIKVGIPEVPAPFDVYAELSFGRMVRVSWKPVSQALQYDVLMRSSDGSWQPVANTKDTTVSVPDLLPNTTYVFLVKAIGKYGESKPLAQAQSNPVTTGADIVSKDTDGTIGEKTVIVRSGDSVDLRLGEDWSSAGSVVDLLKPEYAGAKNITVRMSAKMVSVNNAPIIIKASDATLVITPAAFRTAEMIQHALDPKAGIVFKMIRSNAKLQAKNGVGQVSSVYELQAFAQVGAQQTKLNQLSMPFQLTIKSDAAKIRARKLKKVSLGYYDSTAKLWVPNPLLNKLGFYGMWGSKK